MYSFINENNETETLLPCEKINNMFIDFLFEDFNEKDTKVVNLVNKYNNEITQQFAIDNGYLNLFKYLLKKNKTLDNGLYLYNACINNHVKLVEAILSSRFKIPIFDPSRDDDEQESNEDEMEFLKNNFMHHFVKNKKRYNKMADILSKYTNLPIKNVK
jgi:hypothetical protein